MERPIRRSCGLKSMNLQICLRHWHTAPRHYLQPGTANASANVTIACFTSTTPARKVRVAGVACNCAGIGLRLQLTQLASVSANKSRIRKWTRPIVRRCCWWARSVLPKAGYPRFALSALILRVPPAGRRGESFASRLI